MALLPAGFVLPPWPYALVLVTTVAVVVGLFIRRPPAVTAETVLGLAPWMAVGSALHAWYVLGTAPAAVAPLFGAPAVYGTVFAGLGAVWFALETTGPDDPLTVATRLGAIGGVGFVAAAILVLADGRAVSFVWPVVGLAVAAGLAVSTWMLLGRLRPEAAATAGWPGALVVFAHALDGVSTAIGIDVLGFGERTPLSRAVMDVAAMLPTADAIGVGWLFVVVKLAVAGAVVVFLVDLVEDAPRQGYVLLAVVAAVGLGPGVHNLLLYAVAG